MLQHLIMGHSKIYVDSQRSSLVDKLVVDDRMPSRGILGYGSMSVEMTEILPRLPGRTGIRVQERPVRSHGARRVWALLSLVSCKLFDVQGQVDHRPLNHQVYHATSD